MGVKTRMLPNSKELIPEATEKDNVRATLKVLEYTNAACFYFWHRLKANVGEAGGLHNG